ncbi:MAG: acetyl-CoA carboxylase biotin carboxyl carrier protein subunit [Salinivirgaceae bacterium]|nr:acetyl-CoA carboxylase biotin carboxyl carrier protein subunit [Salinivirgaceae bacterium]
MLLELKESGTMRLGRNSKKELKKLIAVDLQRKKFEFSLPFSDELKINGKIGEVIIKQDDKHGSYLIWKNKKYPVEVLNKNQNKYEILLNGVSYYFTIETPTSYKRFKFLSAKGSSSKNENLEAPMPGKIIEVLTEEGREVRAGEPLLILEAMKMQNEIQSPIAGKVKKIYIKAGESVLKDDLMIEIHGK